MTKVVSCAVFLLHYKADMLNISIPKQMFTHSVVFIRWILYSPVGFHLVLIYPDHLKLRPKSIGTIIASLLDIVN